MQGLGQNRCVRAPFHPAAGEIPVSPGSGENDFNASHPFLEVMRTNRHQYFLDLALRCAHQGTCLRRNFGAIIVDEFNTIVSTGYTGAPRKQTDCTEIRK
jgi:hypothetical protein